MSRWRTWADKHGSNFGDRAVDDAPYLTSGENSETATLDLDDGTELSVAIHWDSPGRGLRNWRNSFKGVLRVRARRSEGSLLKRWISPFVDVWDFEFEGNLALVAPKDVARCSDLYYLLEGYPIMKRPSVPSMTPALAEVTTMPRGKRERASLFLRAACIRLVQLDSLDEVRAELSVSERTARFHQRQRDETVISANRGEICERCGQPLDTPPEQPSPRRCHGCLSRK